MLLAKIFYNCQNGSALRKPMVSRAAYLQATRLVSLVGTESIREALAMTETELKLIAAPAMIGLRSTPKKG
jgi:hypothetical protein